MSGRSGYANGYGYSDAGQYDRSDGGYGNLGVNGYSGGGSSGGGSRDYRPGGYGGFYPESSPQQSSPFMPGQQSPDRRRDHSSSSRSRTREVDDRARLQVSRDGRHPGDANWGTSGRRDRSETGISPSGNARGAQAVEGLNLCSPPLGLISLQRFGYGLIADWCCGLVSQMCCDRSKANGTLWPPTVVCRCRWL